MNKKHYSKHETTFHLSSHLLAMLVYAIPLIYYILSNVFVIPALLGYLCLFVPLFVFLFERKSEFLRFHAAQSTILNLGLPLGFQIITLIFALLGLHQGHVIGVLFAVIYLFILLILFTLPTYCLIKASSGWTVDVPLLSKLARYLAK